MTDPASRLRFDPEAGTVIRTPPGSGYGYWAGGHKVWFDPADGTFVLFYRERSPLERGRGARCAVAVGDDGIEFTDVWTADKTGFAASSIEVGHAVRYGDEWRLYISYELAGTSTWRIDVLRGSALGRLDTQGRRTVLSPGDYGLAWIKDPVVALDGTAVRLYAAAPPRTGPVVDGARTHAGPLDATVLAESADGLYFPTIEYVFEPAGGDSWHGRRARINSLFPWEGNWVATWDGGRTFYDNYEEWCGLAVSGDGRTFERIDTGGPWVRSQHGAVRYVYGLRVEDRVRFYYEYTRPDGSHDLRVSTVNL